MHPSERGNILFLILLVVVLFAALSYAVTSGMRSGGKDVTDEKAQALAAQIHGMIANTANGLQRFLLANNYTIENIDLFRSGLTMTGNADSCVSNACNLFDPAGGNVTIPIIPAAAVSTKDVSSCAYFMSNGDIKPYPLIVSVNGVGTALPEVVMYYCGISEKVCEAINVASGVKRFGDAGVNFNIGGSPTGYASFTTTFTSPMTVTTAGQVGASDSRINNVDMVCNEREKLGSYTMGNILVAVIYPR